MTTSQSLKNAQTLRPFIDPSSAPWNADPTGVADATAAFNTAFEAARADGAFVVPAPGVYKINGSLNPAGVSLFGPGVFSREVTDYTTRGVVLLHNGSTALFAPQIATNAPSGSGWVCEGITIYDPNQPGTSVTPVVRPPIIEPVNTARLVDITFNNNVVVNCYVFMRVTTASLIGDVRITSNRIYAISTLFSIERDVPDVMFVANNMFSPGVYQSYAVFANAAKLAIWSGANATAWGINAGVGNSIDGFKSCNNIYFGFFAVFAVDSGSIDVSTSTGDNFDAVSRLVITRGTGGINGLTISGGSLYCYEFNGPGGAFVARSRAFEFTSSGASKLSVSGLRCEVSAGDWVVDAATAQTLFDFEGYMGPYGTAVGAAGDRYAFRLDNPSAEYNIKTPKIVASYVDAIGVSVARGAELLVTGTAFNGLKNPVVLEATISAGSRITLTGCMSRNTTGAKSVQSAAPVGVAFQAGCRFDQPSDITPTV